MATSTLADFTATFLSPDSATISAHTSGSTGTPKHIRLPKTDMRVSALATCKFFGIRTGDTIAAPLSLDYIAGKMMAVRGIVSGARVELVTPSNRPNLDSIEGQIKLLAVVPSQVDYVLSHYASRIDNLLVGGAPVSTALEQRMAVSACACYVSYGMTETCSHVALRKVGGDGLYHAMPAVTFDIDGRGCLVIRSDSYSFGSLVSNDLVRLADSTAFEWLGRYDNVINSGGVKIYPEQVEKILSIHIKSPLYISGHDDEKWGTRVVLHIEDPVGVTSVDAIDSLCRKYLPAYSVPREIVIEKQFTRTISSKIIRR